MDNQFDSTTPPIVLTATIVPNAPFTRHVDVETRRREYLDSIRFYQRFAPVHFLENSEYDLLNDPEFKALPNCRLFKFPASDKPERGKGYQELQMLDRWVSEVNPAPARFLKITGRYQCRNIGPLLQRMRRPRRPLIIDVRPRPRAALSSLFLVDTDFYREHLLGQYENCDEDAKRWAERVLYNRLSQLPEGKIESLPLEPDWAGISGTFGTRLETPRWRFHLKGVCRRVNRLIDRERLWYGKH